MRMRWPIAVLVLLAFLAAGVFSCAGKSVSPRKAKEAEAYYFKGLSYMQKNMPYDALSNLKKAVELDPNNAQYYNALGLVYYATEVFDKAEESYKEAIRLDPTFVDSHHNLGVLYNYLGRYAEAIEQFELALASEVYRDRANTYNAMGWAYFKSGNYEKAEESFKNTIKRDRMYLIAYDNLGKVYIEQGRYEDAVDILEQVLRLKSDYPEARLDLGIAYLKMGKKLEAKTEFERALALDPHGEIGKQAEKYLELLR